MKSSNKILIGGKALVQLGSSRSTKDTDYLVNDTTTTAMFSHDIENDIDYINANGHEFFAAIYKLEAGNEIASPQSLLELKAFAFVQHCINFKWQKVSDCEYDIAFLVRKFNLTSVKLVNKHITTGQLAEVNKVINSVRK